MTLQVDTNVLVYDAIEKTPYHVRASDFIDVSEDPLINQLSIVELGFVLPRYGVENDGVMAKLDELLHSGYFRVSWISEMMLEDTLAFIVENSLSFRDFNDRIISYDAHSTNVPLVKFNKTLSKKCKLLGIYVIERQ
jgi:predicted nucleic acid-binding protein